MAKGVPHRWTLDELEQIWAEGFDAEALAEEFDVSENTIYSMRSRIRETGGVPAILLEAMHRPRQERGKETLDHALARTYLIRKSAGGRNRKQTQYTVTIPPALAEKFIAAFGTGVRYEPDEDGILIVPIKEAQEELPGWMGEE